MPSAAVRGGRNQRCNPAAYSIPPVQALEGLDSVELHSAAIYPCIHRSVTALDTTLGLMLRSHPQIVMVMVTAMT